MQVTAALVKELRSRSGAAMMDCKNALVETNGDVDKAIDYLRKSGAAKDAKKASRIAAEGAVAICVENGNGVIVEINSETDFVAKDENFTKFSRNVAATILNVKPTDVETLGKAGIVGGHGTIEDARQDLSAKVGEKISLRRFAVVSAGNNILAYYLHGIRIGVIVVLEGGDETLAKDIAMHIAASNPVCVSEADIPVDLIEKEKEIQSAQAEQTGKPPEIIEKIVLGRIRKFIAEITLNGQAFVKDPDNTVGKLLQTNGASVSSFIRYEVGAGIEKKEDNFAEEVMAQTQDLGKGVP